MKEKTHCISLHRGSIHSEMCDNNFWLNLWPARYIPSHLAHSTLSLHPLQSTCRSIINWVWVSSLSSLDGGCLSSISVPVSPGAEGGFPVPVPAVPGVPCRRSADILSLSSLPAPRLLPRWGLESVRPLPAVHRAPGDVWILFRPHLPRGELRTWAISDSSPAFPTSRSARLVSWLPIPKQSDSPRLLLFFFFFNSFVDVLWHIKITYPKDVWYMLCIMKRSPGSLLSPALCSCPGLSWVSV